jgi:hypothetical protein
MKGFSVALFVAVLWASLSAVAQYTSDQTTATQSSTQTASSSQGKAGKLEHLKGKISDDGKTFTSDKDKATWTISNPEAVKGHEGHDVRLRAHVYPDKNEIHVMSVKMVGEKSSKKEKGGAMSEQPPQ